LYNFGDASPSLVAASGWLGLLYFGRAELKRANPLIESASELQFLVELRGFEPLTPSMRTVGGEVVRGR
jgi:hypothetical protein